MFKDQSVVAHIKAKGTHSEASWSDTLKSQIQLPNKLAISYQPFHSGAVPPKKSAAMQVLHIASLRTNQNMTLQHLTINFSVLLLADFDLSGFFVDSDPEWENVPIHLVLHHGVGKLQR